MTFAADRTLAEIVTVFPEAAPVLERRGLDFCCRGHRPLGAACADLQVSLAEVQEELRQAETAAGGAQRVSPVDLPLEALMAQIVAQHHEYVRRALPGLRQHAAKVAQVHGEHYPEMRQVNALVQMVADELEGHLAKEEEILFPYIAALVRAQAGGELPEACFASVAAPIQVMESEHEHAGRAFDEIRVLTHGYAPPPDACPTFRLLLGELQRFEEDLHVHVHKENYVLHPRARALEAALAVA